jgi:hypothetical protein
MSGRAESLSELLPPFRALSLLWDFDHDVVTRQFVPRHPAGTHMTGRTTCAERLPHVRRLSVACSTYRQSRTGRSSRWKLSLQRASWRITSSYREVERLEVWFCSLQFAERSHLATDHGLAGKFARDGHCSSGHVPPIDQAITRCDLFRTMKLIGELLNNQIRFGDCRACVCPSTQRLA